MKIYLGADYTRKAEISKYAKTLRSSGYELTSRWHDEDPSDFDASGIGIGGSAISSHEDLAEASRLASQDLDDLKCCDQFILFTTGELSRGGRHTELGIALALSKRVAIVGPIEHIFQCWPRIDKYDSWENFLIWNT